MTASSGALIGIVTDPHIGPPGKHKGGQGKLNQYAPELLTRFVEEMNDRVKPDLVVNLGDSVQNGESAEQDRANFQCGLDILNSLSMPVHHCIGNHDQVNLQDEQLRDILGLERLYYSFDAGEWHYVILYSKAPQRGAVGGVLSADQLDWLAGDLKATDKPVVILVHHPLADHPDLNTSFWFADYPPDAVLVSNRAEARRIIQASGKVAAVVNGHLHWNRCNVHEGVPYFTVQSLVENVRLEGFPAGAFAVLQLEAGAAALSVHGRDPAFFRHPPPEPPK